MPDNKIVLDAEAERFFRELGGIETDIRTRLIPRNEEMDAILSKEEEQLDVWYMLLVDAAHLIGSFLSDARLLEGTAADNRTFSEMLSVFSKISQRPFHDHSLLIRYRGIPKESTRMGKTDYQVVFGDITVDMDKVASIINRRGSDLAYLSARAAQAFDALSDSRINNLYVRFPGENSDAQDNLFVCLQILSRYEMARKTNSPIFFLKKGNRQFCPIMFNESNRSDLNLTMLAGLNGMKPEVVHSLIQKVGELMAQAGDSLVSQQTVNVFSMLFNFKKIREKFVQPAIEVNNVQWLIQEKDGTKITREKIQVGRLIMDSYEDSPQEAARVLDSVYGDDYKTVSTTDLGQRLHLASDLLDTIKNAGDAQIEQEVVKNIEMRLDIVNDDVFDDIFIDGSVLKTRIGGKEKALSEKLHEKLIGLVNFFKARVRAKKKMKSMLSGAIDFDAQDFEVLAKDFNMPLHAAKNLIRLLKDCFDAEGSFRRAAFEQNIPDFARYEKKVFEFLLYYLKETVNRNDRVAFLNSLQLLIAKLQQPQKAISILLDDFFQEAANISFSDRNSIMLSTLLLRKYNQELKLDIEITPEEVLLVKDGLSKEVVSFVSDFILQNREKFFQKIRSVHKGLLSALAGEAAADNQMPVRYLFSLEREIYIFLSLIGGAISVSVLKSALKEYGNPDSDIYRLPESQKNIAGILQLLKVLIRGMSRGGIANDMPLMVEIKARQEDFLGFDKSPVFLDNIARIMEWVEKAGQEMRMRQAYR
jgi:hypothetical protein